MGDIYYDLLNLSVEINVDAESLPWVSKYSEKQYFDQFFQKFESNDEQCYDDYICLRKIIYATSIVLATNNFFSRTEVDVGDTFFKRLITSDDYRLSLSINILHKWMDYQPEIVYHIGGVLYDLLNIFHMSSGNDVLFLLIWKDKYRDSPDLTLCRSEPNLIFYSIFKYILSIDLKLYEITYGTDLIKSEIINFGFFFSDFLVKVFEEMFIMKYSHIIDYYYGLFNTVNSNLIIDIIKLKDMRSVVSFTILSSLYNYDHGADDKKINNIIKRGEYFSMKVPLKLYGHLMQIDWKLYIEELFIGKSKYLPYILVSFFNFIFICYKYTYIPGLKELFNQEILSVIEKRTKEYTLSKDGNFPILTNIFNEIKFFSKISNKFEYHQINQNGNSTFNIHLPPDYEDYFRNFGSSTDQFYRVFNRKKGPQMDGSDRKIPVIPYRLR